MRLYTCELPCTCTSPTAKPAELSYVQGIRDCDAIIAEAQSKGDTEMEQLSTDEKAELVTQIQSMVGAAL